MKDNYNIYLISDSTGETLDRIFLALQAQFSNFQYDMKHFAFVRTNIQIDKILSECKNMENVVILYTIVDNKLAKYLNQQSTDINVPCFGVLGDLILNFSKLLNQKATHKPSGQHVLDDEYYKRIEAIQFTMAHDDGKLGEDLNKSDIVLLGVSRTSKTPTSIYLANRGFKTSNVPILPDVNIDNTIKNIPKKNCVVGLYADPKRLCDVRKNRLSLLNEQKYSKYVNVETITKEVENSKKIFAKYGLPTIDVTRKSVEETAASIIKIYEIKNAK